MNRQSSHSPGARITGALLLVIALAGCAAQSYQAGAVAPVHAHRPDAFSWEGQALEAVGAATAPAAAGMEPQRSIAARRAAKTASIARLKEQVGLLPVVDQYTLGSLMQHNIGLRHAIESYLQKAQVLSEHKVSTDTYEARVRLPLAPVGDILRQYQITPEGIPDVAPLDDSGIAPLS